jgi:hypothetical protein
MLGDLLLQAISSCADGNIDFIDAFNDAWLLSRGLTAAYTLNHKRFSRLEGIRVQVPGEYIPPRKSGLTLARETRFFGRKRASL